MGVYDEEELGLAKKYRVLIVCGIIAAIAIAVWFGKGRFEISRARQDQKLVMIDLLPPPSIAPPPPPPSQLPPPPMETEEKMIAQEPVNAAESKADETPSSEPPSVGTSLQGDGPPDGFGLRQGNSFFGGGMNKSVGRGGNSQWGWYANQVQRTISQALQNHKNTRAADFRIVVQIWSDRNGRITRAHIAGSTGNQALEDAIKNEVLIGHVLQEPPPDGMPMPIILRLTARHSQVSISR